MKTVTWEYKGHRTTDYYFLHGFQLSKHARKQRIFGWEFHWKGTAAWYRNFRRHAPTKYAILEQVDGKVVTKAIEGVFSRTRLTLRLGRWFIIIGRQNKADYYRDVKVLQITQGRKVLFPHVGQIMIKNDKEKIAEAVRDIGKDYWHLSRDYPSDTWRN